MAELRPAAEVVEDIVRAQGMGPKVAVLQADREEQGEIVAHDVVMVATSLGHPPNSSLVEQVTAAVRAVAKPLETERELLGQIIHDHLSGISWEYLDECQIEHYYKAADACLDALAKIREESA